MRRPPSYFLYSAAWTLFGMGLFCLALVPFQRAWQSATLGVVGVCVGLTVMAFLAWMRDRYNEWHPGDRGLIDAMGFPVSRSELMSDALATRVVNLVWPSFRSQR